MEKKEIQYKTRIGKATAKSDNVPHFPKGEQKEVYVSKMATGRLAIYKGTRHFKEESGYKCYDSIEDLENDFVTETVIEAIG